MTTTTYGDVEACVDAIFDRLGTDLVVGTPLAIGKANHILNELVRRAVADPDIELEIWSALSLSTPEWESDLERRLVEPLSDRIFDGYPELEYDRLLQAGELPDNIEVNQFYYQPGKHVNNPDAQQSYYSVNYTHAQRTFREAEPDLLLQLVGTDEIDGDRYFNIASNTDLSHDLIEWMLETRESGERDLMIVGQVSRNMPFLYGDAPVPAEKFDAVLDDEAYDFPLFSPPKEPVSLVDHAIGLRVSSLLPDGGTLQIGIGSLGDAIGWATELRHHDNDTYRDAIDALGVREGCPELIAEYGGLGPFEEGIYGSTEMFVEAFLHLYDRGVLCREVYDDLAIQRLVDDGHVDDGIDLSTLDALVDMEAISGTLDADDVDYLQRWGIVRPSIAYEDGRLKIDGEPVPADLADEVTRDAIADVLGDSLDGGTVLHGAFFMGSSEFYERLRTLDDVDRKKLRMRSVKFTNQLYGQEELKRLQRRDARFVNTGMKATLTGAVASDGLEDGRVVSGVGGQFNFVNQAHELDGGRSILMIRSTRESSSGVESNVVWNYGHVTIPRHLRDIVVTEYGVADLRGKSDAEVAAEMIKVADSRFQNDLVEAAKDGGKLPADWEVPERYRDNYPETLERTLGSFRESGILPPFPHGTELTEEELALGNALRQLESSISGRNFGDVVTPGNVRRAISIPDEAEPYLERMDLVDPDTIREHALQRAVVLALSQSDAI